MGGRNLIESTFTSSPRKRLSVRLGISINLTSLFHSLRTTSSSPGWHPLRHFLHNNNSPSDCNLLLASVCQFIPSALINRSNERQMLELYCVYLLFSRRRLSSFHRPPLHITHRFMYRCHLVISFMDLKVLRYFSKGNNSFINSIISAALGNHFHSLAFKRKSKPCVWVTMDTGEGRRQSYQWAISIHS